MLRDGEQFWGDGDPVAICNAEGWQRTPKVCFDGTRGAFFSLSDPRDYNRGTEVDIYAQHIDIDGDIHWGANGFPISRADRNQNFPVMVGVENETVVIAWVDDRNWDEHPDVYVSEISGVNEIEFNWGEENGVPVVIWRRRTGIH